MLAGHEKRERRSKTGAAEGAVWYYRKERAVWWKRLSLVLMLLLLCTMFAPRIWQCLISRTTGLVTWPEMESRLEDSSACFLCGEDAQSMISYYRQYDTIGLISLNDWYVMDLGMQSGGEDTESSGEIGASFATTNTGLVQMRTESVSRKSRTSVQVSWPVDTVPNLDFLEAHLCQNCLDKTADTLTVSKSRYEKKTPLPFCLVDFRTMELYALQDWCTEYSIRDYWVDLQYSEEGIRIRTYHLL
jgi:hypothetical protein